MKALITAFMIMAGCSMAPPADRESLEYDRIDSRLKATERYNALRHACRTSGGIIVLEAASGRVQHSPSELKTARCVKRLSGGALTFR